MKMLSDKNQESRVRKMAKRSHYNIRKSDDGAFALVTKDDEVFLDGNLDAIEGFLKAEDFLKAEERRGEKIPLRLISEPDIRFPGHVKKYAKWLKEGKRAPPIELIELVPADGRQLKQPYDIYDGHHRYTAAVLVGRKSISAIIVDRHEDYLPWSEDEYVSK
jgi:hypothetical protein